MFDLDVDSHKANHHVSPRPSQSVIGDAEYAERIRRSYPEYTEKPLSEQLEPIAVVGMGKCQLEIYPPCNTS
jgi:hypothetical protein